MKKIAFVFLGMLLAVFCHVTALAYPQVEVTARVIDEVGEPIQGADVHISFEVAKETGEGWGTKNFGKSGFSDPEGFFTGAAKATGRIGVTIRKEGYYFSRQLYNFTSRSKLLNRWEPWNPTVEVVLKKKRNPVAMYRKGTGWITVPTLGEKIGYDLEKGDWVAPYGRGTVSDFVFLFEGEIRGFREYDLSMSLELSNERDGIQEYYFSNDEQSYYKWPFEAPIDGYQNSVFKETHKVPGKTLSNRKKEVNYIFRVRTKIDKDGNIMSARYGKVLGEFDLSPDGNDFKFRFAYHFNPDGTRNLEEDPEKNLFKK